MLGGVQLYKEPFLLPIDILPVGLGDIRRLSESKGLQERTEGRCLQCPGGHLAQMGSRALRFQFQVAVFILQNHPDVQRALLNSLHEPFFLL